MTFLYLGKHHVIDVKHLIEDLDFLAGLLEIPGLKLWKKVFIDVITPVVHFQGVFPVGGGGGYDTGYQQTSGRSDHFLHFQIIISGSM